MVINTKVILFIFYLPPISTCSSKTQYSIIHINPV